MFKSKHVFPRGTPVWVMNQRGRQLDLWIIRREDEIRLNLWKRLFG